MWQETDSALRPEDKTTPSDAYERRKGSVKRKGIQ
jgi:hypothetical protein